MRHRLKDVAERAGVSVKTVSNVVNGYQHVRPDTRARVEAAIAELRYRPNLSARNLRKGRTGVIALAVPELDVPYFAELARHVVAAAADHGWTVLIDQTGGG
ncbi:LacI family DNA-binding transcriptional regulator, partial [Streptomyces sp. NPDC052644]